MAVLFKLHKLVRTYKDNRQDPANNKWFARAIHVATADTDKLADQISYSTTVTPADCRAVLKALGKVLPDMLQNGFIVKLDNIGTFKLGISCEGAETVNDFSIASNIKGAHVNFYPEYTIDVATGKRIVKMTEGAKFSETPYNDVTRD